MKELRQQQHEYERQRLRKTLDAGLAIAKKNLEMEKNAPPNQRQITKTDDHAFQRNVNRLGAVRKHIQDASGRETNIRRREILISSGDGLARGERKNFKSKT